MQLYILKINVIGVVFASNVINIDNKNSNVSINTILNVHYSNVLQIL